MKLSLPLLSLFSSALFALTLMSQASERPDRILAEFEGDDFDGWRQVDGTAFVERPATLQDPRPRRVKGVVGNGYASSSQSDPAAEGKLHSPKFVIDRKYINFYLGGEGDVATSVRLLVGGEIVRRTNGLTPGILLPWTWDVSDLEGKEAIIEVRDRAQHPKRDRYIMADDFRLSDTPLLKVEEKSFSSVKGYLNIPLDRVGRPTTLVMTVDGKTVRKGDLLLSSGQRPDYWISLPLEGLEGKDAKIALTNIPPKSIGIDLLQISDKPIDGSGDLARNETIRPQFHYSPRNGFMNDPNGMVYLNGEWHLFFQLNGYGLTMDNQSWGHTVMVTKTMCMRSHSGPTLFRSGPAMMAAITRTPKEMAVKNIAHANFAGVEGFRFPSAGQSHAKSGVVRMIKAGFTAVNQAAGKLQSPIRLPEKLRPFTSALACKTVGRSCQFKRSRLAEMFLSPVGISAFARLAPQSIKSQVMGIWFLRGSLAGLLAGAAGSAYEETSLVTNFATTTVVVTVIGAIIIVLTPKIRRLIAS